jgi:uncharacterized membrane protein YkgB
MNSYELNIVAICFFFLGIFALCVLVYVAFRYLDEIEELLSKSVFVSGNRRLYLHAGILGKVMRICTISTLLTTPYLFARRGLVDEAQLKSFPISMKRLLVVAWCTMCISSAAFLAFGSF